MLIAYDAEYNVVATLDYVVSYDDTPERKPLGLIDFGAHEDAGGEMTDVWNVSGAAGSKVWPEWLGGQAYDFKVELVGPPGNKRIGALVHKASGYRRDRSSIESAIEERISGDGDLRDLVGGPNRPILLDETGRSRARPAHTRPNLPVARSG